MRRSNIAFVLFFITGFASMAAAQDTLPKFSVRNVGNNRIIIGWTNPFDSIRQLSIQRSFDSLKNFRTILTVPDPRTRQNGFVDTKAPNDHMFYRIYILLERGQYLFSDAKRPVLDTVVKVISTLQPELPPDADPAKVFGKPGSNGRLNVLIGGDSLAAPTVNNNSNRPKADPFVASRYVYTFPDGYVKISLPDKPDKKYMVKFFTMDDKPLFELRDIKEREFKIDKTSFYRSGWYKFELYEDGNLLEKYRFYLPREF